MHPVPDRVKPSFVIFDIRALWCIKDQLLLIALGIQLLLRPWFCCSRAAWLTIMSCYRETRSVINLRNPTRDPISPRSMAV